MEQEKPTEEIIRKEAINILEILRDSKKDKYTTVNIHDIFMDLETLVSSLAFLIAPLAEYEQNYRLKVVEYLQDNSNAKAETLAKASDEYKKWKKLQMVYDLAHEQIMVLKKFKNNLEDEMNRN